MKVSYLLVCSIVLITTIIIGGCSSEKSSFVLKCSGYETNGTKKDGGNLDLFEKTYNFSNLNDKWEMFEGEDPNGIKFTNQESHFKDFDTLDSLYVNKDHIFIFSSSVRDDEKKNKDFNHSEVYETIGIDRNSGKWVFTYLDKERDKNNKLIYDRYLHVVGSCE